MDEGDFDLSFLDSLNEPGDAVFGDWAGGGGDSLGGLSDAFLSSLNEPGDAAFGDFDLSSLFGAMGSDGGGGDFDLSFLQSLNEPGDAAFDLSQVLGGGGDSDLSFLASLNEPGSMFDDTQVNASLMGALNPDGSIDYPAWYKSIDAMMGGDGSSFVPASEIDPWSKLWHLEDAESIFGETPEETKARYAQYVKDIDEKGLYKYIDSSTYLPGSEVPMNSILRQLPGADKIFGAGPNGGGLFPIGTGGGSTIIKDGGTNTKTDNTKTITDKIVEKITNNVGGQQQQQKQQNMDWMKLLMMLLAGLTSAKGTKTSMDPVGKFQLGTPQGGWGAGWTGGSSAYDPNRRPGSGNGPTPGQFQFASGGLMSLARDAGSSGLPTASQIERVLNMPKNLGGAQEQAFVKSLLKKVADSQNLQKFARGGIAGLPPRYLRGKADGMADTVAAKIDGRKPAALSSGEFVVPADVVSHLGNGNSEAGAGVLYDMMGRVRNARTGTPKQGRQIVPKRHLPV